MKNTILKTKYFITGLLIGLTLIGLQAFAAVTGAGTIGSLFQQVGNSYKLIGTNITDNSITSAQIAAGTINKANLNSDSVGTLEVINNSLTAADLANNSVGNGELANNSVNSAKVINNSLTAADLANNSVGNGELANNSVNSAKVINNSLTAADLANNSVGNGELAANSVNSAKVINNSLTAADLANNSVGNGEIANNSVNSAKVLDGSIKEVDLANAVTVKLNASSNNITPVSVCNASNLGKINNMGYNCKSAYITNSVECIAKHKENVTSADYLEIRYYDRTICNKGWEIYKRQDFFYLGNRISASDLARLSWYRKYDIYVGFTYVYGFF